MHGFLSTSTKWRYCKYRHMIKSQESFSLEKIFQIFQFSRKLKVSFCSLTDLQIFFFDFRKSSISTSPLTSYHIIIKNILSKHVPDIFFKLRKNFSSFKYWPCFHEEMNYKMEIQNVEKKKLFSRHKHTLCTYKQKDIQPTVES